MVRFRLSAFSDEYSPSLEQQIEGLVKNKVKMTELRGVDGMNISDLTPEQAADTYRKLNSAGISVWAIGSPIGKIKITDPMDAHIEKLKRTCEIASIVKTGKIRMFSFYIPDGNYDECRNEVIDRLGAMLDVADNFGIKLCHENKKGIYGDTPEHCLEILKEFDGRLGCVFDPANFVQCGCEPFEHSFNLLKKYITYLHVKDSLKSGVIVPAGMGVGSIPELLAVINNTYKGDFILTIEPHLRVFSGLSEIEEGGHRTVGESYPTAALAFEAAVTNLRYCIPKNADLL